jgi:hypothetical protein
MLGGSGLGNMNNFGDMQQLLTMQNFQNMQSIHGISNTASMNRGPAQMNNNGGFMGTGGSNNMQGKTMPHEIGRPDAKK